ncbi:bacterio-opsin activator domain-containing protein [Haladaptatus sp. DYF46]|uniref:bacterio-opsin activator domain-containing protein n=1 Tax=Haladaptatus sp. DYF46 TaxID=2886041 RepID=UPI001E2D4084|nr:bacterio-opsin activator domain-containing protein [Haladaptatus sp. DYF46]
MAHSDESDTDGIHSDRSSLIDGDAESAFFRTLIVEACEPVLTLDTSGRIRFANRAAEELFGYDVAELTGSRMRMLFPPRDDRFCVDAFEEAIHEAAQVSESIHRTTFEWVGRTANGKRFPLRFSFTEQDYGGERFFTGIVRDLTEREERRKRRRDGEARFRQIAEHIDSVLWMSDADLSTILYVNPAYEDVWGQSRESLYEDLETYIEVIHPDDRARAEQVLLQMMRDSKAGTLQSEYTAEYRIVQPDGTVRWIADTSFPVYDETGDLHRFVGIAEDTTRQKRRQSALERQREILQTISKINAVLRQVNKSVVEATTQSEIETLACESIANSDLYRAALISDLEPATDGITIRNASNVEASYLDAIRDADSEDTERGAAAQALETGDIQVVNDIETDPEFPTSVRRAALSQGYRLAICVPLSYGETTYGVLVVYGSQTKLLSDRERKIFDELGATLGYAIYTIKMQQLLFTDRVVELEFDFTGTDAFFFTVSDELDCQLTLDAVVPTSTERLLYYVTASDVDSEDVLTCANRSPRVEQARCISTHTESSRFEFLFKGDEPALQRLIELGAHIHSGRTTNGEGSLAIRVPAMTEVRPFVDAMQTMYPEARLAAKREFERSIDSPTEFRKQLQERLTDRQREVVQMAYHGGYFESPRKSTGEELAGALGISPPTFHQHLQAAHRKLFTAIFTETSRSS